MEKITKEYLIKEYNVNKKSVTEIAKACGTYPNKIYRLARTYGLDIRDRKESQKLVIEQGKRADALKGKKLSPERKEAIRAGVNKYWDTVTPERKEELVEGRKEVWKKMTAEAKERFSKKGTAAVLKSAKIGSKMERFLYDELVKLGYQVEFHKVQMLMNDKLEIDLYLPKLGIAIEIDGLSHFEPIWGEQPFQRTKRADKEKAGLLLSKGLYIIRVKNIHSFSIKFAHGILNRLISTLSNLPTERYIEI